MEENKQKGSQSLHNPKVDGKITEELKKINQIQKSVADMQAHIKFLLKRQNLEEKKLTKLYDLSIKKTIYKITNASQLAQNQQQKLRKSQQKDMRSQQLRQIRERGANMMKQTRLQISKLKQQQRCELKQISKRNDEKIKQMKDEQKNKNFIKANNYKKTHLQRLQQRKIQKQNEKKQKQDQILKKSILRLQAKQEMQYQIKKLKQQEEQITTRLEKKKELKQKLNQTTRKISCMKCEQVIQKTKTLTIGKQNKVVQEKTQQSPLKQKADMLQSQLIKSAVKRMKSNSKQKINLYR